MTNYRAIKRNIIASSSGRLVAGNLGMAPDIMEGRWVKPEMRWRIVDDVHRTMNALHAHSGVPAFLRNHNWQAMNALMGVEGFLMPARLASYNDLRDESFSGIFQFGPNTFGHHAPQIAARLNAIKNTDHVSMSTLREAVEAAGYNWSQFEFKPQNIWRFHDNPVVQTVGAVLHHGERLNQIDALSGIGVSHREQMALLAISHNIPRLSQFVMGSLIKGTDESLSSPRIKELRALMKGNPALYQDTNSLRGILSRVADYMERNAGHMHGFALQSAAQNRSLHSPTPSDEDRKRLTQIIREAMTAELTGNRNIGATDRAHLTRMIAEVTAHENERRREERAVPIVPRTNPDEIIRSPLDGMYRTRASVESDMRAAGRDPRSLPPSAVPATAPATAPATMPRPDPIGEMIRADAARRTAPRVN